VPDVTDGVFRAVFFFSFFGLMVSLLGFLRRLPLEPCCPTFADKATWGIDVTVSVSTVMLCSEPSPVFPLGAPVVLADALDCLVVRGGGALAAPDRRSSLMLPLSLPLSEACRLDRSTFVALVLGTSASSGLCKGSSAGFSSSFAEASSKPFLGEAKGLAS
jgi:hypothetical protein